MGGIYMTVTGTSAEDAVRPGWAREQGEWHHTLNRPVSSEAAAGKESSKSCRKDIQCLQSQNGK